VRIGRGVRNLADDLTGPGVGHEEIDREQVPLREEDHLAAVGTEFRADVQFAPLLLRDHRSRHGRRHLRGFGNRAIRIELRCMPVLRQLFGLDAEDALDRLLIPTVTTGPCPQHVPYHRVAVLAPDERPQGLPVAVREVPRVIEIIDLG
jgi:hypothetical protein